MEYTEKVIRDIVCGFVDYPSEVELHLEEKTDTEGDVTVVNIKVRAEDVGACIGERGSTADALRRIVGLVGFKQCGKRVFVRIDAPKMPRNHFYS